MIERIPSRHTRGISPRPGPIKIWSPRYINNLIYWWDFSDHRMMYTDAGVTRVANDADLIYQINDKSGLAGHATQATSGSRPQYKQRIQRLYPASLYDGTDDNLAGPINTNLSAGYSIFFVGKPGSVRTQLLVSINNGDAAGIQNRMQFIANSDGSISCRAHQNATGTGVYIGRKTATGQYVANTLYLFDGHYDGGTLASGIDVFINGVEKDTLNDSAGTFTGVPSTTNVPIRIGSQQSTSLSFWLGHIFEIIVYNAEITDAEKQAVRKYLNGKYRIY